MYTHTHTHTHTNTIPAIKNNEILPFSATWMDLDSVLISEISQTEKENYCIISLTRSLKNTTDVNITKKQQTHREQTSGYQ